jgi:hypothetical protein
VVSIVTALNMLLMRRQGFAGRGAVAHPLYEATHVLRRPRWDQLLTCACGTAHGDGPSMCAACAFDVRRSAKLLRLRLWLLVLADALAVIPVVIRLASPDWIRVAVLAVLFPGLVVFVGTRALTFGRLTKPILGARPWSRPVKRSQP